MSLFHLAFPVDDLELTREFYVNAIGCRPGREADTWIDFDLFGHQISAHLRHGAIKDSANNAVDGDRVPIPHFGCILNLETWHTLKDQKPEVLHHPLPTNSICNRTWTVHVDTPGGAV